MTEKLIRQTLFGDSKSVTLKPIVTNYAPYGIINDQIYKIFTGNGGTITSNANGAEINLDITTAVGSFTTLRSTRVIKYRPGYTNAVRQAYLFDTPVANSLQFCGLGNAGSDFYFVYNGTDFGIRYSTNGLAEVQTLTINVAENTTATATITLDGTIFIVSLTNAGGILSFTAHEIELGIFTGWNVEHIDNTIIFQSRNVGPRNGVYSYTSTGASTGTFAQTKAGADLTTVNILQSDWNANSSMIRDLDPLKKNMYEVEYTWYGIGNVEFRILNPRSGKYETVHILKFANSQVEPSVTQPNMFIQCGCASLGSTTALRNRISGMFGGTWGDVRVEIPLYSAGNQRTINPGVETVIIAIKNRQTINGFANQSEIKLARVTFAVDGNRAVTLKIIKNPTTLSANTTADYTDYDYIDANNSITLSDNKSLTYTGGLLIDQYVIGKDGSLYADYFQRELVMFQDDVIIFTATSTQSNVTDISVTWVEDI